MTLSDEKPGEAGLEAFHRGDFASAFAKLSEFISSDHYNYDYIFAAAASARAIGRHQDALNAAEKILKFNESDVHALVIKGDALSGLGKNRQAMSFFLAALKSAPQNPSPQIQQALQHAQQKCAQAAQEYQDFLRKSVAKTGAVDPGSRNEQAMEILLGGKQIYYQQPEKFYFPELPQRQFYDPAEFNWVNDLIAAADDIRGELNALLADHAGFVPYVDADSDAPHVRASALTGSKDWSAFHLLKDGVRIDENADRCPKTMAALANTPQANLPGKSPIALFSRLAPGAHIPPHTGLMNTRLICHLPLITPGNCSLRVGNQTRIWRDGEMLIFDDSIEHEARNESNEDRIILLFDIWRPELSAEERKFVATVFDAIEEFGVF